jgi:hypothetical protein
MERHTDRRRIGRILLGFFLMALLCSVGWSLRHLRVADQAIVSVPGALVLRTSQRIDDLGSHQQYRAVWLSSSWPFLNALPVKVMIIHPHWRHEELPDGTARFVSTIDGSVIRDPSSD